MKEENQDLKTLFDLCYQKTTVQQQEIINNSQFSQSIKDKVRKLLAIDVDNVELTSNIIENVQLSLDANPIATGMKIESYVLQRPLGKGGQGEVWLAQRDTGDFNHQVAIKFLKPLHNQKELDRFNNERELLAQLKHNNIAQLLGGGQLADKRPYMILELVEGMTLMEYCQQNNYSLTQYLQCFLQICDAISYAHSHLVIHRDIKPSNIFINDDGVVKLLDFGIAKIIDTQDIDTQTVPIMTLAYSSPEQVSGASLSTATDIYTLGLVLYEMLTGQRAQAVNSEVPTELIHEITEKIPTHPSQVENLIKLDRDYSGKQLKGDLDNLILMAVRKEPQRRYATVAGMANDVKNYLQGKPLIATGDSVWYKTKKLITRNPSLSVMSLLTIGFLIALPIILYNSQAQIKEQRDLEIIAKKDAQQQTQIAKDKTLLAERTTDFLFTILESASPLGSKGQPINLDDVLKSAERQLEYGLENQPQLKIALLNKLAAIWHHIGSSQKAIAYYEQALKLTDDSTIDERIYIYGQLAIMHNFLGEMDKVEKYTKLANATAEKTDDPYVSAWHHARMATINYDLGEKQKIREIIPKVIAELKKNNITDAELLGRLYNELSISQTNENAKKRLEYINKALGYAESLHGKMHPKYQNRLINKANTLIKLKRYDEAEAIFLQAKIDAEKLFTKNHPKYSYVIKELAYLYNDKGRFAEAEKLYLESIEISKNTAGINSRQYIFATNNIAYLYEDMGLYEKAEIYYRESLQLRKIKYTKNKSRIFSCQANLARVLAKTGQYKQAQSLLDQVIPFYILENKSNLSNNIAQTAITAAYSCPKGLQQINKLMDGVQKLPENSYHRMNDELWLGQLSFKCQDVKLAKSLLLAAQEKSKKIYTKDSDGQKRIAQITQDILKQIN